MSRDKIDMLVEAAWDALAGEGVFEEAAERGLAAWDQGVARLRMAGRELLLDPSSRTTVWADGTPSGPVAVLLALRYLARARETFPRGQQLPFRKLPDVEPLLANFRDATLARITEVFSAAPDSIVPAGERLGGRAVERMGDAAVEVTVFPRVPVTFVVWAPSRGLSSAANVFFDETAFSHLETEDLALAVHWLTGLLTGGSD